MATSKKNYYDSTEPRIVASGILTQDEPAPLIGSELPRILKLHNNYNDNQESGWKLRDVLNKAADEERLSFVQSVLQSLLFPSDYKTLIRILEKEFGVQA